MNRNDPLYFLYLKILKEELQPAFGCTEPAAIAYAAALAAEALGVKPERINVSCSGNIIKNVKSVIVPNAGGKKGIEVAVAAGIAAGHPEKQLELLGGMTDEKRRQMEDYLQNTEISIALSDSPNPFDIQIDAYHGADAATVRITGNHTNVALIQRNGEAIFKADKEHEALERSDREALSVRAILDFAESVALQEVTELLDRQIACNTAISDEGLKGDYGANIGSVLLSMDDSLRTRLKAMAAAGSDARMGGCEMPVIINSGSGNQGITVSVPVITYAREKKLPDEKLYRALVIANLLAIYQRAGIGCLSAYCGAINAGVAAACGVAYLNDGTFDDIAHTLVNGLAIASGVICDGAKASCASKIALGIDAGLLGYEMYQRKQQFFSGEGIVKNGVDQTIAAVAQLGRDGMRETDREILHIMID